MHSSVIILLTLIVAAAYSVPITPPVETTPDAVKPAAEDKVIAGVVTDKETVVEEVIPAEKQPPVSGEVFGVDTVASSGETTTSLPQSDSGERGARQVDDDDDDEGNNDDDDDEEEDDGEEEEEEERKLPPGKAAVKPGSKKKAPTGKPVPVLGDGVEDDEAEDLGIFEREDVKSDEKSNEEKSEEDQHDEDDDESGEDDERSERPSGLVADPSSNERGDAYENSASLPAQNEVNEPERPLAVAVVEREEEIREPVPVVVEDTNTPSESQISQLGEAPSKPRKNKPKKEAEEDDEDDDEEDEEDEEEAARSEKVSQARAAYPSPVLYYYPFPESPASPSVY